MKPYRFEPGDRCDVLEDAVGYIPPSPVMVLQIFPEQLILTDDAGYVRVDCEVVDATEEIWVGHTENLRKLPDDDGGCGVSWDDIKLWRPDAVMA